MDKKTVLENQREFLFWLNDGEILYRYKNQEHYEELGWMKMSDSVNFFTPNCIYVMNDKAVEFRKAIADGKKIKFRFLVEEDENGDVSKNVYEWRVLDICNNKSFSFNDDFLCDYMISE